MSMLHMMSIHPHRPHRSSIIAHLRPETAPAPVHAHVPWLVQQLEQRRGSGAAVRPGGAPSHGMAAMLALCNRPLPARQLAPAPEPERHVFAAAAATDVGPSSTSAVSASLVGSALGGFAAVAAAVVAAAVVNELRIGILAWLAVAAVAAAAAAAVGATVAVIAVPGQRLQSAEGRRADPDRSR